MVEAVLQGGYGRILKALETLAQQTKHLREANEKDDALDENRDGIPDVQQISKQELASRKLYLYLKCSDPDVLSAALHSLYTGKRRMASLQFLNLHSRCLCDGHSPIKIRKSPVSWSCSRRHIVQTGAKVHSSTS